MMLRARRDRLDTERDWELARLRVSSSGIIPSGDPHPPALAAVPRGRRHSVKSSGIVEVYD